MSKVTIITGLLFASVASLAFLKNDDRQEVLSDQSVYEVLFALGEEKPDHYIESTPEMIQRGEDLIFHGRTEKPNGRKSKYISKFYKCTSCHNTVKEELDLRKVDQEIRLSYSAVQNIPYLQGSTFYGMVNKETWYNDDYVLKYGDLVKPARNSLKNSIQLCAEVCSQGRTLEDWEMNSILAYLWSIQLKLSDLIDTSALLENSGLSDQERIADIKSQYLLKSPATFGELPEDKSIGYKGLTGRADIGQIIYENGCQHCHREKGESDVVLDNSTATLNWLKRNITSDDQLSIYNIIRKGTYSEKGHKEYMPHYTEEKMSDQQIEDLRAFIEQAR